MAGKVKSAGRKSDRAKEARLEKDIGNVVVVKSINPNRAFIMLYVGRNLGGPKMNYVFIHGMRERAEENYYRTYFGIEIPLEKIELDDSGGSYRVLGSIKVDREGYISTMIRPLALPLNVNKLWDEREV